jgi:flagellar hook-associated protein 2
MAIRLSGMASGMDTETMVQELMKAQRMKSTKLEGKKVKLEWKQEKWQELNKKLYSFYTGPLTDMRMQGNYSIKSAVSTDSNKVRVTAGNSAVTGNHQIKVNEVATAQYVTGAELKGLKDTNGNSLVVTGNTTMEELGAITASGDKKISINGKDITVTKDTKVSELEALMRTKGINASFDKVQKRFFLSSKTSGSAGAFSLNAGSDVDLSKLGLGTVEKDGSTNETSIGVPANIGMKLASAQNAKFEYNGAEMTATSNTVTVNGLTFELLGKTGTEAVNINVKNDTQAVYDKIKAFVKGYNEILTSLNEMYNAPTSKGYNPLTDEEKEAMSEKEVEKWETKIKTSLFRREEGIGSLISRMRADINVSVEINGKKYGLASFGVKGTDYTEKGLLHIAGDKDDSTVANKSNDLMKALEENPEAVMTVFTKFAENLYSSYADSMGKSSTLRSTLTFYNDKEMKKQIEDYNDKLKIMEEKLADIENRYYKQFTAMEKAMANMNSKSNSLAAMLGTGQK